MFRGRAFFPNKVYAYILFLLLICLGVRYLLQFVKLEHYFTRFVDCYSLLTIQ